MKVRGGRVAAAIIGMVMLAAAPGVAHAQDYARMNVAAAVKALDADVVPRPLDAVASAASHLVQPAIAATGAVATAHRAIVDAPAASSATLGLIPALAKEAAWLYRGGWPLYALVDKFATAAPLDAETTCLATAVYFEARGESLDGQLAVARVVMNRAASGRYPPSWCATIRQPYQFSFVRNGRFPKVDTGSDAWRKAQAIAELAAANIVPSVGLNVLWYHADYVAPSWRRSLEEVEKIGAHIFYRS